MQTEKAVEKRPIDKGKYLTEEDIEAARKRIEEKKKNLIHVYKYINKKYVEPALKENPKLEKKIRQTKALIAQTTSAVAKKNYEKKLMKIEIKYKVNNLWIVYSKAYVKNNEAIAAKDNKTYRATLALFVEIRKSYKSLTGNIFPNPEKEFYKLYGKKLKDKKLKLIVKKLIVKK